MEALVTHKGRRKLLLAPLEQLPPGELGWDDPVRATLILPWDRRWCRDQCQPKLPSPAFMAKISQEAREFVNLTRFVPQISD
jgi:hypothetical protein